MFKTFLISFAFLLLQINTYAVGSDGNISSNASISKKEKKGTLKEAPDNPECDLIVRYDEADIYATIIEVKDKKVYFNICDEPDSEIDSLTCRDVRLVYLVNGQHYKCLKDDRQVRSINALFTKNNEENLVNPNQHCDVVVTNNNEELDVNIVSINYKNLLFKTCGAVDSAIDSIALADVKTYRKKYNQNDQYGLDPTFDYSIYTKTKMVTLHDTKLPKVVKILLAVAGVFLIIAGVVMIK